MSTSTVYLVGAGPGDAGLMTIRGMRVLERADVVIYDYLASPTLLDCVPARAKRVYVGKKGFERHITQPQVNDVIIEATRELDAQGGGTIVRLKGGDPFVFGRGGEEAQALRAAGIAYEVIPGITSAIAASAYAGIPVTHRGTSSSVTLVTGHEDPEKEASAIDWLALSALVERGGTVCFYMGMRNLGLICESLIAVGAAPGTPVAIIQWGTTPRQRTLTSTLENAADDVRAAGLGAPSIILIGKVARLRDGIAWFERRALFGRRVVVTRSRAQASELADRLAELGADVCEFPTIEIVKPDSYDAIDDAVNRLGEYRWIVFTSVNGVDAFFSRLALAGGDARRLAGALVAAIGPATANRLKVHGIQPDAVPVEYRGEAVFDAIAAASANRGEFLAGARVLVPRVAKAREALPELLREAGALVDVVAAYKTIPPADAASRTNELARALEAGEIDALTFTSSSTARNLFDLLEAAGMRPEEALANVDLFSIGPVTSATIAQAGLVPTREATDYTISGLIEALLEHYETGAEVEGGT